MSLCRALAVRFQQAAHQRGRALEQYSLPGSAALYKGAEKAVDFAISAGDHDHDALHSRMPASLVAGVV